MEQSITHFPKYTQQELSVLQELILKQYPTTCMIILYGSYARGTYVLWDERWDFGTHTTFQSDLDILIVTDKGEPWKQEMNMREKVGKKYDAIFEERRHPDPQLIVENINALNNALEQKRYFYTDIIKDGILLYDNHKYQLSLPRNLSYREIKDIAQEEFDEVFPYGADFLDIGYYNKAKEKYKMGSFLLHQACERFYYCVTLVFTHYKPKCHKLDILSGMTKRFSRELACVFPVDTQENWDSYDLLCRAYIEARYNKTFKVNEKQYEYMITHTEKMGEVVDKICREQLAYYEQKALEEESKGKEQMIAPRIQ